MRCCVVYQPEMHLRPRPPKLDEVRPRTLACINMVTLEAHCPGSIAAKRASEWRSAGHADRHWHGNAGGTCEVGGRSVQECLSEGGWRSLQPFLRSVPVFFGSSLLSSK